jgi:hypothetical protein
LFKREELRDVYLYPHDCLLDLPSNSDIVFKYRILPSNLGKNYLFVMYQIADEIERGLHDIEEPMATILATMMLHIESKNLFKTLALTKENRLNRKTFNDCPVNLYTYKGVDINTFNKRVHMLKDKVECKFIEDYIHETMKLKTYGSCFFPISVNGDHLVLAINIRGCFLLTTGSRLQQQYVPFNEILGWSYSTTRFVLKVKNKETMFFNVIDLKTGYEVCNLLQTLAFLRFNQ